MSRSLKLVIATILVSGTFASQTAKSETHDITIGNNFFSPLKTTVNTGDIVRWTWIGGIPHSTTSDAGSPKTWTSLTTSMAEFSFQVQFLPEDGPGPFPYHCAVHPGMKDTIFVNAPETCCTDRVGDANGSGEDEPTIGDVSILIDAKFISLNGELLGCLEEADINQSGGAIPTLDDVTIGDVSLLIDYLFITGPSAGLADCL